MGPTAQPAMQKEPLLFIENKGQVVDDRSQLRPEILFTAQAGGTRIYVTGNSIHYVFSRHEKATPAAPSISEATGMAMLSGGRHEEPQQRISLHHFRVELVGANPNPQLVTGTANGYYENYYLPQCLKGVTAQSFERFTLKNVYAGVDWVVYANGQSLKYDFVARNPAAARQIKLKVHDAEAGLNRAGELVMMTQLGYLKEEKPVSFQQGRALNTRFTDLGNSTFAFELDGAGAGPLVIDPSVVWGAYIGGSNFDVTDDFKTDSAGNHYLSGQTSSINFPVVVGFQQIINGNTDGFLTKLSNAGQPLWSTYVGGSGGDDRFHCAIDRQFNIYVSATTRSADFPVSSNAVQDTLGGDVDGFLLKLRPTGAMVWASYVGKNMYDELNDVEVGPLTGNVYVTGCSQSFNLLDTLPDFNPMGIGGALVLTLDSSGRRLKYQHGFAGPGPFASYPNPIGRVLAIDENEAVYMAGTRPPMNYFYPKLYTDVFVSRIDSANGWYEVYGVDNQIDYVTGMAANQNGVYVVGSSHSSGPPTIGDVRHFSPTGSLRWHKTLTSSTYSYQAVTFASDVALDNYGNVLVAGYTYLKNFAGTPGANTQLRGATDLVFAHYDPFGREVYKGLLPGDSTDMATGISFYNGRAYIAGYTRSATIPSASGFLNSHSGASDAFLLAVDICDFGTTSISTPAASLCVGQSTTLTAPVASRYLWSTGDTTQSITVSTPGSYTVQTFNGRCTSAVSAPMVVTVNSGSPPAAPTITITGAVRMCPGESVTLSGPAGFRYRWSTGDTTQAIVVKDSGEYNLRVIDNVCTSPPSPPVWIALDTVPPAPRIVPVNPNFCDGDTLVLVAMGTTRPVIWNNGFTGTRRTIRAAGTYSVRAISGAGCLSLPDTISIAPVGPVLGPITRTADTLSVVALPGTEYYWYLNNQIILGPIGRTKLTITGPGMYSVYIVRPGLCNVRYSYLVASAKDLSAQAIQLSPNPAHGQLNVSGFAADARLSLHNSIGQQVLGLKASHSAQLNLQGLPAGVYMLRLSQGERTSQHRVVVE